jgi:hypothetical protein
MPINLVSPPSHVPIAAAGTLQRVVGGLRNPALASARPESLHLSLQHAVYNLTAADVTSGRGLAAASQTAWRYLVDNEGASVATVEQPEGGPSDGYLVIEGPRAAGFEAAVSQAEALEQAAKTQFDLRVLRVPALNVELLWLSAHDPAADLLIPVDPAPSPFEPARAYSAGDAMATLREVASHRDLREGVT